MNVLHQIIKPFQEIFQDQFFIEKILSQEFFLLTSIMMSLNICMDFRILRILKNSVFFSVVLKFTIYLLLQN